MELTFLGATKTVTGSKYLLKVAGKQILVDCGLFQGYKALRDRNWSRLPVDPKTIDAVILTHAHIDHTGYLPILVRRGFTGPILATPATCDLCEILLPDSGHIHEEDARRANLYGYSKHKPALPLYTAEDGREACKQLVAVDFHQPYQVTDELTVTWHRAGHIFGAASVRCSAEGTDVLFSGDMGRPHDPIMKSPEPMPPADVLVLESTYGDRLHDTTPPEERIGEIIRRTAKRGGSVLIPSFAVGRAQAILYYLSELKKKNLIPDLPIYMDSPMAIDATKIMLDYAGEHRLNKSQCIEVCKSAVYTRTVEESKAINQHSVPSVIISASGMATGGRVLHHLKWIAPDHRNTILFTGYQAGGTRGEAMINGAKEIKIHGEHIPVQAEVDVLTNTSAHADYQELLDWLALVERPIRQVFITHGEESAAAAMKAHLEARFGWAVAVPDYLETVTL